jgi:tripartite-type tricarboxylate transporter receptor subunit TctC
MTQSEKIIAVVACCVLSVVASSFAQEVYPNKAVQILIPAPPGGTMDLISRIIAEKLREELGQPFVAVNKPGATGEISGVAVATAKPDGYNLLATGGPPLAYLHLAQPNVPYGLNDFGPVAAFAKYPLVILVNKELPVKSLGELAAYAKKNPGKLSYGNTGHGGGAHLAFELFKTRAMIPSGDLQSIPYNGVAPILTALLGNQLQAGIFAFSALVTKQIEAGTIRAMAVLSAKRFKFLPDIPTVVEAGFPELAFDYYLSFWAPAKTPAPVVSKLGDAIRKATEDKGVRGKIEQLYHEVEYLNSQDLRKYTDDGVSKWVPMIQKLNLTTK